MIHDFVMFIMYEGDTMLSRSLAYLVALVSTSLTPTWSHYYGALSRAEVSTPSPSVNVPGLPGASKHRASADPSVSAGSGL